jgi:four helix bundle protein
MNERLPYVNQYQELEVYRKAIGLTNELYQISKTFPKDELYSLTSQIRRSSRSIGAQIAEAWAKRLYTRHFISKLSDADAENNETEHWISISYSCGYISKQQEYQLRNTCKEIGKMLGSMILKASAFCDK